MMFLVYEQCESQIPRAHAKIFNNYSIYSQNSKDSSFQIEGARTKFITGS